MTLLVVLFAVIGVGGQAGAHTALESSIPADGSAVDGPVGSVELTFNRAVEPVVENFELVDPSGQQVPIASVDQTAPEVITVVPGSALESGDFGAVWSVLSEDGHPVSGSITFAATAPPSTGDPAETSPTDVAPTTVMPDPSAVEDPDGSIDSEAPAALSEALEAATTPSGVSAAEVFAWLVRVLSYSAVLFALGGLIFVLFIHTGPASENRLLTFWIRRAALLILFTTVLSAVARAWVHNNGSFSSVIDPGSYQSALDGQAGFGLAVRALGAMVLLAGVGNSIGENSFGRPTRTSASGGTRKVRTIPRDLEGESGPARVSESTTSAVSVDSVGGDGEEPPGVSGAWGTIGGAVAILVSFLFIGHTATEGPRVVTATTDFIHLLGASAWVGGAAFLAITMWNRRSAAGAGQLSPLVGRFSLMATIALIGVAAAGVVLSVIVLPTVSALWETTFGLILIAKVVVVAAVAAVGARNNYQVVPGLAADPADPTALHSLKQSIAWELFGFALIIALTAALVSSSATP